MIHLPRALSAFHHSSTVRVLHRALALVIVLFLTTGCDAVGGKTTNRLTAPGGSAGYRVATDGQTAVVTAFSGAASVYARTNGGWERTADLLPQGLPDDNHFGWAVAVERDVLVIANPTEGGTFEQPRGAAYVFERQGGTWVQTARLVPTGLNRARLFGRQVAVSGEQILVVSGRVRGIGQSTEPDAVQVFEKSGTVWTLAGTILSGSYEQSFDSWLAVDGDVAFVGGTLREVGSPLGSLGTPNVAVLRRGAAGWSTETVIPEPEGLGRASSFGYSIAVDGDRAVLGAGGATVDGIDAAGAAFVFERSGGTWAQTGRIANPEPSLRDFFAYSVGIEGETVVAGSETEDRGRGAVFTFERSGGVWSPVDRLSEDLAPSSTFGARVSLARGVLLVGAPYDRDGAAYVYTRSGAGWTRE